MADVVWEGKIGSTQLRVDVPHAGRILADWETPAGKRHKSCSSVEEFERAVLFQILVASGQTNADEAQEVLKAVAAAEAERPAPPRPEATRRKSPKPRRHRRSRSPSRRR